MKTDEQHTPFGLEVQTSGVTVARLGQAAALATTILLGAALLMTRAMPPVWHFDHKESICWQPDEGEATVVVETGR